MIKTYRNSPVYWFCTAVSIPSVFVGYAVWAMTIGLNLAGIVDHLLFISIYLLVHYWVVRIPHFLTRFVISIGMVIVFGMYCIVNVLYFRFFNTWIYSDFLYQIHLIPSIWSAVCELLQIKDIIFGFVIPIMLCILNLISSYTIPARIFYRFGLLVIILAGFHVSISSRGFRYSEHNPFLHPFRQKMQQVYLRFNTDRSMSRIAERVDAYRLINKTLYRKSDSSQYPFEKIPLHTVQPLQQKTIKRPNIVLIIMESVRAFESGAYGANPSFTPQFDRIAQEGLLFKNMYANSSQTTRAEFAILASYLPHYLGRPVYELYPKLSVVTLPTVLKKHGYKTMWISSYTPHYGNKKEFLSLHGIDEFFFSVPHSSLTLGWGPSDEEMFDFAFDILAAQEEPFFAEIMTLSNHFPFNHDYPTKKDTPKVSGSILYQNYTRGIYYTDYALGKFISKVRTSNWGCNSILIITADNGVWIFPDLNHLDNVQRQEIYFRVPLLIWAPNIIKPQINETLLSQLDIAPTLLDILHIHERNSFLGTSVLRHDTDERFVLMLHDERWNLRSENIYMYDAETQAFRNHFPYIKGKLLPFEIAPYACFIMNDDLMRSEKVSQRHLLPEVAAEKTEALVEEALKACSKILYSNRVSRTADAFSYTVQQSTPRITLPDIKSKRPVLIAHAGGGIHGLTYTNSLEALNENYKNGHRFFEIDFEMTSDSHFVLIHDWDRTYKKLFNAEGIPTLPQFLSQKMIHGMTPLDLDTLIKWLNSHREVFIVTDFKSHATDGLKYIKDTYPEYLCRFIPQVSSPDEYLLAKGLGYKDIILTLYKTSVPDSAVINFVTRYNVYAVTLPIKRIMHSDLSERLKSRGIFVYAHTVNIESLRQILAEERGVRGFYTDFFKPE